MGAPPDQQQWQGIKKKAGLIISEARKAAWFLPLRKVLNCLLFRFPSQSQPFHIPTYPFCFGLWIVCQTGNLRCLPEIKKPP